VVTGLKVAAPDGALMAAECLQRFPVALLG
jgi:hypothetical protein